MSQKDKKQKKVTIDAEATETKKETEMQEQEELIMGLYTKEEWTSPIFPDGPTRQEVEEWKQKYKNIYLTPFEDENFIWRALTRPEYREIIQNQELTMLDKEELICDKIVLFPRNFSIKKYIEEGGRAGIPTLLSEMAMDKSGFIANSTPIKL